MANLSRRAFGRRALVVLAAVPLVQACGGSDALVCAAGGLTAQQQTMRTTLHYVDVAADASRRCIACALYTGNETSCGVCTVVAGSIHPLASCDAFVARPS